MNTLRFEQLIPRSVSEIFPFFSEAKNLELLTPPWLSFHVLKTTTPEIQVGTLIDYKLKIRGFPMYWQTRIEEWVPMQKFVDTQLRGPYKLWHHTHEFIPQGSGTLMIDTIRYQVPLGQLGQILAGWYVKNDIQKIFNYRQQVIAKTFGGLPN